MFESYLGKAQVYLEFGSGGSTLAACRQANITNVAFVESDPWWYHHVLDSIKCDNLSVIPFFCDMNVLANNWGHPGPGCTESQMRAYTDVGLIPGLPPLAQIDMILVDGRFRVACCLKLFSSLSDNCVLLFDDFYPRKYYQIVLDFFQIIEDTADRNMVVLRKKQTSPPSQELIAKYELDSN
jgi:hypothetical protein